MESHTINEEIGSASSLKENTDRWENDGKNDLANIAVENSQLLLLAEGISGDSNVRQCRTEIVRECFLPCCERHDVGLEREMGIKLCKS